MRRNKFLALVIAIGFASAAQSQTLELQATCAAQAKRSFQEYSAEDKADSAKFGMSTLNIDYRSHYNTKINRCLIVTEKMSSVGGQTSTTVELWDALERRQYAIWLWQTHPTKKYWEVPPVACELTPNYQGKRNCTTREEFDAFVAQYMEE
jgi:hypothetical protein